MRFVSYIEYILSLLLAKILNDVYKMSNFDLVTQTIWTQSRLMESWIVIKYTEIWIISKKKKKFTKSIQWINFGNFTEQCKHMLGVLIWINTGISI